MGKSSDGEAFSPAPPVELIYRPSSRGSLNAREDEGTHLDEIRRRQKRRKGLEEEEEEGCPPVRRPPSGSTVCPLLFERSSKTWWNPSFDSDILEDTFRSSTLRRTSRLFQLGLVYVFVSSAALSIYYLIIQTPHYLTLSIPSGILALTSILLWAFFSLTSSSFSTCYLRHHFKISSLLGASLISLSLCSLPLLGSDLSQVGSFALYLEVLLLLYGIIPLPLYTNVLLGLAHSILYEVLVNLYAPPPNTEPSLIIVRILLHLCVHAIGCHILITTQVRMRDTFMKVGYSLVVKKQLVTEKGIKEQMILSVMPPKVADWLLKEGHAEDDLDSNDEDEDFSESGSMIRKISSPRSSNQGDIRTIFRPFNMNAMENVSILFADIVGFTKMSSNKTASQLVGLLNDLFGRFDDLCTATCCEKISTLGDCYYCVSGCPEPTPDHARNCVEMGLAMIRAIREFDDDRNESVNMRVGIHTGTVLCGIVGKKRFKFDVWSNDVSLANRMESTGKPGLVHISEATFSFLKEDYFVSEGESVKGINTYFITGRVRPEMDHLKKKRVHSMSGGVGNMSSNPKSNAKSLPSLSLKNMTSAAKGSDYRNNITTKLFSDHRNGSTMDERKNMLKKSISESNGSNKKIIEVEDGLRKIELNSNIHFQKQISFSDNGPPPGFVPVDILGRRYSNSLPVLAGHKSIVSLGGSSSVVEGCSELLRSGGGGTEGGPPKSGSTNSLASSSQHRHSDLVMIQCVQEDPEHHMYFTRPPLGHFTLCFKDWMTEVDYRRTAWQKSRVVGSSSHDAKQPPPTIASSNGLLDVIVVFVFYGAVSLALFISFPITSHWLAVFALGTLYLGFFLGLYVSKTRRSVAGGKGRRMIPRHHSSGGGAHRHASLRKSSHAPEPWVNRAYAWCQSWYPSHFIGSMFLALPQIFLFANFACLQASHQYLNLFFAALLHITNLSSLSSLVKTIMALINGVVLLALVSLCPCEEVVSPEPFLMGNNITSGRHLLLLPHSEETPGDCIRIAELSLHLALICFLICILNREFEISYRLSFHCSYLTKRDRKKVQNLKNQADWLLHNIIPRHVSESLKKSLKYSENHLAVGIIFASLVNFNELYDESYMGGKEYLRVLNELISDFDEILDRPEFSNVEKIKTIGSTLMAASGLNPYIRKENIHKYQHIHELMEFVLELQRSVHEFNQSLIEFDLILRVGFHFGDVTAGVIGTTKLFFDIWGDAVNIASRMESTGVEGRVQVSEKSMHALSEWYNFQERGPIFVKGKDNMTTYLLIDKKLPPV